VSNYSLRILSDIKEQVYLVLPDAQVFLFGSQVRGTATEESDWDILILTQQLVNPSLKDKLHQQLFPLSVQSGRFINSLVVQEYDWYHNPAYYSLHQTIDKDLRRA